MTFYRFLRRHSSAEARLLGFFGNSNEMPSSESSIRKSTESTSPSTRNPEVDKKNQEATKKRVEVKEENVFKKIADFIRKFDAGAQEKRRKVEAAKTDIRRVKAEADRQAKIDTQDDVITGMTAGVTMPVGGVALVPEAKTKAREQETKEAALKTEQSPVAPQKNQTKEVAQPPATPADRPQETAVKGGVEDIARERQISKETPQEGGSRQEKAA